MLKLSPYDSILYFQIVRHLMIHIDFRSPLSAA